MPEEDVLLCHKDIPNFKEKDILRFEEFERLVRIMAGLGIKRLRLTGGEPLVRRDVPQLARKLKAIEGIETLGVTTNGVLLEQMASALLDAGVNNLNISLDTTDPDRYYQLTRHRQWHNVRKGLDSALSLPFRSVKINCVLSPESCTEDWMGVVALAKNLPVDVRLIEWMPISQDQQQQILSGREALERIRLVYGEPQAQGRQPGAGPAFYYQLPGFLGRLGLICAMSDCFCDKCNRLRLTAIGDLKLCLFYDVGISLKPMLRGGAGDKEIEAAIAQAVQNKPRQHAGKRLVTEWNNPQSILCQAVGMAKIGG
jgi:cyclic pyranopterin phosphate synthase